LDYKRPAPAQHDFLMLTGSSISILIVRRWAQPQPIAGRFDQAEGRFNRLAI